MLYSDLMFVLGIFPVITILSLLDRSAEYKNLLMILGSALFLSWGKPFYVCAVFLFSFLDWCLALIISKNRRKKYTARILVTADIILNAGGMLILGQGLFIKSPMGFNILRDVLPLCVGGILLRGLSYVLEVYRGEISAEKNYFCLITYTSSLYLLGAGSVPSYKSAEPQIRRREITVEKLSEGLTKIFIGMGKIVIISASLGTISNTAFKSGEALNTAIGILCFFGEYLFLFTGLWDMSSGLGLAGGFEYPENYRKISADKLFTGLFRGFNMTVVDTFEKAISPVVRNKFMLALSVGIIVSLWYKTSAAFLLIGLMTGVICGLEATGFGKLMKKAPYVIKGVYVFILASAVFSLAYFNNISQWADRMTNLFSFNGGHIIGNDLKTALLNNVWLITAAVIIAFQPLSDLMGKIAGRLEKRSERFYGAVKITKTVFVTAVFFVSVILSMPVN